MAKYDKSKSLGSFYPYYCTVSAGKKHLYQNLENLLKNEGCRKIADEQAILQVLNRYFMFGDRTIFKNVKRAPWMAKLEKKNGEWIFHKVPGHGTRMDLSVDQIAETLFELLCDEIKLYVEDHRRIGILLSGGMDSRIVATVLNYLMINKEVAAESVTAYTWGVENCRDVVYSRKIAQTFGWEWKHFRVEAEDLWENFRIAGERGCEYSGLHLHAIPQISRNIADEVDVMLAGSYGDSVGRAEYSGRKVKDLAPIQGKFKNPAFLIKSSVYNQIKKDWKKDVEAYHRIFPRDEEYQQRELDRQIHYMRRMLSPCMELINEKVDMYQAFTHPDVFGFMWSLHPDLRNDRIYERLLQKANPELLTIPWARTGLVYPLKKGEPDQYKKTHHEYSKLIQEDLIDKIKYRILNKKILNKQIFNDYSIKRLVNLIENYNSNNFDSLERLTWLISCSFFIEKFKVKIKSKHRHSVMDWINGNFMLPAVYLSYHLYRGIKRKNKLLP